VRIGQVIGERVRAQREERGWTQAKLGEHVGSYLGQDWSRQAISAAEKGKRSFTAAELLTFADVLGVSISYLMTPPPEVDVIEIAPGIDAEAATIVEAATSFRGTDSAEEKFTETGRRFFQHLADLRRLLVQVQADMEAFVADLQAVHAARKDEGAEPAAVAVTKTSTEAEEKHA
jgi:transcriptional regulator with XRE-family HTH domain